jgi:hypothetical protein
MDGLAKLDRDELVRRMRVDYEQTMRQVADAVNAAPDGHLIDGSEEQVRDLLAGFRRRSFEIAAQMRVEATEASPVFSPGASGIDSSRPGQTLDPQLQRASGSVSASLPKRKGRN